MMVKHLNTPNTQPTDANRLYNLQPDSHVNYPYAGATITEKIYKTPGTKFTLAEVEQQSLRDFTGYNYGSVVVQTKDPQGKAQQYYVQSGIIATKGTKDNLRDVAGTVASLDPNDDKDITIGQAWPFAAEFGVQGAVVEKVALPMGHQYVDAQTKQGTNSPTVFGGEFIAGILRVNPGLES